MIANTDYIVIFSNYLLSEKRRSGNTISAYSKDLRQLQVFCEKANKNYSELSTRDLRSWIVSLVDSCQPKSITRKIATLKSFYKFLFVKEYLDYNPAKALKNPKIPKRLPTFIEQEALNCALDLPQGVSFSETRDILILDLLYGAGLRREELINLKHSDINSFKNLIKVKGKGSKERIIPVTQKLKLSIENYILQKKLVFGNICDELIVTDTGNKSYPSMVYRTVVKSLSQVTLQKKKSPHVLRHSYATHLLNGGADLNAVKELLGHSSLASTQVYTHNSLEKIKLVFSQAHPKA